MTNAVSKTGGGDRSGSQSICAFSKRCNIGFAGVCGGLFGLLEDSNLCAIHAKRVTIMSKDMQLV